MWSSASRCSTLPNFLSFSVQQTVRANAAKGVEDVRDILTNLDHHLRQPLFRGQFILSLDTQINVVVIVGPAPPGPLSALFAALAKLRQPFHPFGMPDRDFHTLL